MSKKRCLSIVALIIGVVLIVSGLLVMAFHSSNKPNNNIENDNTLNNEQVPEEITLDYERAYEIAVSLYGDVDKVIEVKEENNRFVIYVKKSNGDILNTFNMDKKTGVISEEEIIIPSYSSN